MMRITITGFDDDLIKHKELPINGNKSPTTSFRDMNRFAVVMIKAISGISLPSRALDRDISSGPEITGRQK